MGFQYNGTDYVYIKNIAGDVIAIADTNGQVVVEYTYDAWGKVLSVTGTLSATLGQANPFRFKGYYYDAETGLYYLQSRYYNPDMGRFINADAAESMFSQKFALAKNLLSYCWNNPINMIDADGFWPEWFVKTIAGSETWNKLNAEEKRVACVEPWNAYKMSQARDLAYKWGKYYYGQNYNKDDIQANAFRHAMWNAVGVFMIGHASTKIFTDAHEWGTSGASTQMDYFNNAAGRAIGKVYKQKVANSTRIYVTLVPIGGNPPSYYPMSIRTIVYTSFYYYGVSIPVTGDHYANLALMVKTAANQRRGKVLKWIK